MHGIERLAPAVTINKPRYRLRVCNNDFHRLGTPAYSHNGEDLGARMAHVLASALQRARFAVMIGTDCPAMDAY